MKTTSQTKSSSSGRHFGRKIRLLLCTSIMLIGVGSAFFAPAIHGNVAHASPLGLVCCM